MKCQKVESTASILIECCPATVGIQTLQTNNYLERKTVKDPNLGRLFKQGSFGCYSC